MRADRRWRQSQCRAKSPSYKNGRVQLVAAIGSSGKMPAGPTAKMAVLLSFALFNNRAERRTTNYSALDYDWDRAGLEVDRNVLSLVLPAFPGSLGPAADLHREIL